ncbi:MAG: diacylglycerol kinase family lipid kinase [Paludibacteraceae bacterium]|nr:diacylglycerol kinase family lipid kinase [Paludibacteraceae bacterium]
MKNIAFIINPIAGTINKKKLPKLIEKCIDSKQWLTNIIFTEHPGHATELARQYAKMGFDAVVAVGGDGTINEVVRGLRDTQTALGILPMGSGNGLARHLNIPLRVNRAIEMLNHSEPISIDYGLANDRLFVSTCGTGFDALIAEQFAKAGTRGLKTYLEKIVTDLVTYHPQTYRIEVNDEDTKSEGVKSVIEQKAFLVTFANSSQWGYEAHIAPKASLQDGLMDICLMNSAALLGAPSIALGLFTKSIDKSLFMHTVHARDIMLIREKAAPFHIDGDPVEMEKDVRIRIVEDGLRVLVEKRF